LASRARSPGRNGVKIKTAARTTFMFCEVRVEPEFTPDSPTRRERYAKFKEKRRMCSLVSSLPQQSPPARKGMLGLVPRCSPSSASSPYSASRSHPNLIELTTTPSVPPALEMRYQPSVRLKEHVCDHHKRFSSPGNGVSNPWLCLNHDEGLYCCARSFTCVQIVMTMTTGLVKTVSFCQQWHP
jgi:hypothetical protein